jgi:hypothetical protein
VALDGVFFDGIAVLCRQQLGVAALVVMMISRLFSGFPSDGSMGEFLLYYQRPQPATWVYLSSFLVMGLFFMFHRLWSMRNLDIALLLMLSPGLMMVYEGRKIRYEQNYDPAGQSAAATQTTKVAVGVDPYSRSKGGGSSSKHQFDPDDLKTIEQTAGRNTGFQLINYKSNRSDPWLAQALDSAVGSLAVQDKPLLDGAGALPVPVTWNADRLEYYGFVWLLAVSVLLLVRLLLDTTLVRRPLLEPNLSSGGLTFIGVSLFLFLMANVATSTVEEQRNQGPKLGPGYALLNSLPDIQTTIDVTRPTQATESEQKQSKFRSAIAKTISITANLAIVLGIVAVGYWHFDDTKMGIGAATLYLLLPYTAQMTGRIDHVLPGAMLIWAILLYRFPLVSGGFVGLAAGLTYYPLFLLPLWLSFYWPRGVRRFLGGFMTTIALLAVLLFWGSGDRSLEQLQHMFGLLAPAMQDLQGVWGLGWYPSFRLPVLVAFCILSFSFIWWPAQKNLATLMSGSAAVMVAAQFWHGFGGGLYMAWFLPLVLLTIFRPNLDDRVALDVVSTGWGRISKKSTTPLRVAAGTDAA